MNESRPKLAATARWYVAGLLLLAPLRFSGIIGFAEGANFPIGGWQWVFEAWPPFLCAPLAALAHVLALCAHRQTVKGRGIWPVAAWSALAGASLFGLLRTTEWEYALPFVCHAASAAVLAAAVRRIVACDPWARRLLVRTLAASLLWCCVRGVEQRFGGLARTEEEFLRGQAQERERAEKQGGVFNPNSGLHDKLKQRRVYGPFPMSANLYAAHLILLAPLLLVVLWRAGGRFEPARISRPLLLGLGALLCLALLYWSGSRSAALGLAAGLALGGLSLPALRRWRIPVAAMALLLGIGLMFAVGGGRNLLSASARLQYYRSAWIMFRTQPVTGAGLGEFYTDHLRLRPLHAEPTHMPHNMPLGLAAQAGILAGLAALACLVLPAWLAFSPRQQVAEEKDDRLERLAVVVGLGAWSAHAFLDLNVQVPGTVLTAACLPLLVLHDQACAALPEQVGRGQRLWTVILLLLTGFAFLPILRVPGEYRFQKFSTSMQTGEPAMVLLEQGKQAARWLPTSPQPHRLLGRFAEAKGNHGDALMVYERAVQRAPHRAGFWAQLARVRLVLGDLPGAASAAAEAVRWDPGHPKYQAYQALIRGLRLTTLPSSEWTPLIHTALAADYRLDRQADGGAMVVLLAWPERLPPPLPLSALAEWLAPHAGVFPSGDLPVRFQPAPAWTNGE